MTVPPPPSASCALPSPRRGARIAVIGAGPAGLMAAETLAAAGCTVDVYDAMPSVGRKFLLAGRGGLNLTHGEPFERFVPRYGERRGALEALLRDFGPEALRAWAHGLGIDTFVGSSGRVFPTDLKAAPLLRGWLHRLRAAGVRVHVRHRWRGDLGRPPSVLHFDTPGGAVEAGADAMVLALGGASWRRLGSDGAWAPWLAARGVGVAPLVPSNCGFDVARAQPDGTPAPGWSEHFRGRFAGHPLKNVALTVERRPGHGMGGEGAAHHGSSPGHDAAFHQRGEFVVTDGGVEGSLVYAASPLLRDAIALDGRATAWIDLLPARDAAAVAAEVARPRGSRSLATHLKSRLGLDGVKAGLLHELLPREAMADPARLAGAIKALPLVLAALRPIDEAISSAGGVRFDALDDRLMLRALPGVHVAGEMLDWEAPTGGYLLTACFATGRAAALGVLAALGMAAG